MSFEKQLQFTNAITVRFLICAVGVLLTTTSYGQTAASVDACGSGGVVKGPDGNPHRPYQERTIVTSAQSERKWLIRIPKGYREGTRADVLFNFHGAGSKAETAATYANFDEQADRDGVILVMPDANKLYVDQSHELARYWNRAWEGKFRTRDYDVNFVLELVDLIRTEYCTGKFYAAGMSAGGDITTALQCRNESPFEAFAPVTYRYYLEEECKDAPPHPMISFHGTDDQVVPFSGLDAPWFDPPVDVIMQSWASHNGCEGEAATERVGSDVIRYGWSGCNAPVEWYLIEGGGIPGQALARPQSLVMPPVKYPPATQSGNSSFADLRGVEPQLRGVEPQLRGCSAPCDRCPDGRCRTCRPFI